MQATKLPFLIRLALVLFCIISLTYIALLGQSLLAPLLFSLLMALLLMPTVTFLENKLRFGKSLAAITAVVLMVVVVYGVMHFFVYQLSELLKDWPNLVKQGSITFHKLQNWIADTFHINTRKQESYLNIGFDKLFSGSANLIGTTLLSVSSSLLFFAFTILFTFFLLNYRRLLFNFLTSVFTGNHVAKVSEIVREIQDIIKKYVLGLFLQMLIVSTITIIVLSLLGFKYALLMGIITGVLNIIPYFGIFTSMLLTALITLATASGGDALIVIVAFVAIHAIDGNILMPLIVGSKVKINGLIAFMGIVVGEMLWGISGMFLCIPYLAILKIIFQRVDGLKAWSILLGEEEKSQKRKPRTYHITKKIKIKEAE